jgi:hypothetical protein
MLPNRKFFVVLVICLFFILPVNFSFSSGDLFSELNEAISESDKEQKDNSASTRGGPETRSNYQLISTKPPSMPEVNNSFFQNDWSGGPGQIEWTDTDKFNNASTLNYSGIPGQLRLGPGQTLDAWEQYPDGYGRRYRHRFVWNPTREVFYSFGGAAGGGDVVNELYEYNPSNGQWTRKGQTNPPEARQSAYVVYDNVNNLLWVYGGRRDDYNSRLNDLWSYNPNNDQWTQKSNGPGGRTEGAAAFDPVSRQIVIWGGLEDGWSDPPSAEVWTYNTQTDLWIQRNNNTARFFQDGVYVPKTSSMFFYGGASAWSQGSGYTLVDEMHEYFPNNDTWVSRPTTAGVRFRTLLAWDEESEMLIMHGGNNGDDKNDTYVCDVDTFTWTQKSNGPDPPREYADGGWDSVNNKFVTFGGLVGQWRTNDVWVFDPMVQGYTYSGELFSSVFDNGTKVNPRSVSYNISKPAPSDLGNYPVKIWVAGSPDSPNDADNFIGPGGSSNSFFSSEDGQNTHSNLDACQYLTYKVELSTLNPLYSPQLNWIKIDYYTYADQYEYEYNIVEIPGGMPLREVNWSNPVVPGTDIQVFFRRSENSNDMNTQFWEEVTKGQKSFTYKAGKFFQYRVKMTTTEPSITPLLNSITFTFNLNPGKPEIVSPLNNSWVGDSKPTLSWIFNDPDTEDNQAAFDIFIASEDTFTLLVYTDTANQVNTTFRIAQPLEDGTYFYKIRTSDNYDSFGPWSDMYVLKIDTKKPDAPIIDCSSHPIENVWYSNDRIVLDWNEPKDISGISGFSYVLDNFPDTTPPENLSMTIDEYNLKHTGDENSGTKIYDKVVDGIWYFHLTAEDTLGDWSDTSTVMIKIDTESALITDLTPTNASAGDELKFKFMINDTGSGLDYATITWKYPSEIDYRFDELMFDDLMNWFSHSHIVEFTSDSYIEYYVSVIDLSEPSNEVRYPASGIKKINIVDNEPPEIVEIPGDVNHNRYNNLELTVKVTDNVGVADVQLFLNDQSTGREMKSSGLGKYTITIDRVELLEQAGYAGDNVILYKVKAWDYHNNMDTSPDADNFRITLLDIEDKDDGKDDKSTEDKGQSRQFMINIIIMVIIIVVVALVLFMFVRKQGEKMDEDRHKLRMAIADVSEAATAGGAAGVATPPAQIEGGTGLAPSLQGPAGAGGAPTSIDIQAISTGGPSEQPPEQLYPTGGIDGQAAPVGYLPEASITSTEPMGPTPEQQAVQQAGLMSEPAPTPSVQPSPDQVPAPVPTPADGSVNVGDGVSVSLPGETKQEDQNVGADGKEVQFWTPPDQSAEPGTVKNGKDVKKSD